MTRWLRLVLRRRRLGQRYDEGRAFPEFAFDGHGTAHLLHGMLHYRKAQARAPHLTGTSLVDPVEPLEDPGPMFRRNSDPAIGTSDLDLVRGLVVHRDKHLAVRFVELHRVVQ